MRSKIKQLINLNSIENIYLTGFMDLEDEVSEFYPDMRFIYFLIHDTYIEFQSIEQSSKLKLDLTSKVMHKFEIDEDITPAKSSISEILLGDTLANNSIKKFMLYNIHKSNNVEIICDAVEIELQTQGKRICKI